MADGLWCISSEDTKVVKPTMTDESYNRWARQNQKLYMTSPQKIANAIHGLTHHGEEHLSIHSCGCMHLARYYLGLDEELNLYWPDGKGGNTWKPTA